MSVTDDELLELARTALVARPDWIAQANCRGLDPELFFPGRGEATAHAKAVCRACDVQDQCLALAIANGEKFGVWGGQSERERRRMRRLVPPPPRPINHGGEGGWSAHVRRGEEPCEACRQARSAASAARKKRWTA